MEKQKRIDNPNEDKFLLRMNKDLKKQAEKKAAETHRSLNGYINSLVDADLKTVGVEFKITED